MKVGEKGEVGDIDEEKKEKEKAERGGLVGRREGGPRHRHI